MKLVHLSAVLLCFVACTSSDDEAADPAGMEAPGRGENSNARPSSGDAPRVLLFGTDVDELYPNETVTFSAVVTDPDGIGSVIGGVLETPEGDHQYGAFATSAEEGAYQFSLSWAHIDFVSSIDFADTLSRGFQARFFDADGNSTTISRSVVLDCPARWHQGIAGECRAPDEEGALDLAEGGASFGRLEIFHEAFWGVICDDSIGNEEATVACRELGFQTGVPVANQWGSGRGPLLVSDIFCTGTEAALSECDIRFGVGDCSVSEAVAISCE